MWGTAGRASSTGEKLHLEVLCSPQVVPFESCMLGTQGRGLWQGAGRAGIALPIEKAPTQLAVLPRAPLPCSPTSTGNVCWKSCQQSLFFPSYGQDHPCCWDNTQWGMAMSQGWERPPWNSVTQWDSQGSPWLVAVLPYECPSGAAPMWWLYVVLGVSWSPARLSPMCPFILVLLKGHLNWGGEGICCPHGVERGFGVCFHGVWQMTVPGYVTHAPLWVGWDSPNIRDFGSRKE